MPLLLIVGGGFGIRESLVYGWWDSGGPGAGLLPGLASIALCVFCGIALFDGHESGDPAHRPRLAGYVIALIGFALLLEPLGAVLAIIALFAWTLGIVERWRWHRVMLIAVCAAAFAWVLFDRLLQVPLPRGLLG